MRSRIRLLPETTVNRIAAGEVIERPAAAVKELLENALDAGAHRISVVLSGGGIDRIEVTDDGAGMTAEEVGLCVLRHATSKLTDDNLIRIDTLGFRGEALPSIGAVARLEITSRPRGADHASSITVEGGAVGQLVPAAGPPGTRIVVRDLFFATPARRKFLKNPRTEAEHAEAVVRRLAMAAPNTAFRLENEGRAIFNLPAQERAPRVAALLGPEAAQAMLPVREARICPAREGPPGVDPKREMLLSGYMCAPTISRMTGVGQGLVVNGRPVADPVLKTAVRVAYRDVIAHGRHPVVALWLDLPPEEVDVNVHPAKTELRFRDPAAVRSLVIGALGRVLAGAAGTDIPGPGLISHRPSLHLAWSRDATRGGIRALPLPGFSRDAAMSVPSGVSEAVIVPGSGPSPGGPGGDEFSPQVSPASPDLSAPVMPNNTVWNSNSPTGTLNLSSPPGARTIPAPSSGHDHPLGAAVAQVLDTYIIAVAADGTLILVDQHAAHERLTHEAIRARMLDGGAPGQPLLLPAVVDLPEADATRLLARVEELARLGLEIESFGPGAVLVRALPAALGAPEPAPLIRDIVDELAELDETMALSVRLDAVIARMACHGSIRAGRRLGPAEMDALLRQMEATPRAATCSHGRPTFLRLSKAEIETMFGRR
jgi:DNA mismatch repair protein MutL